MASIQGSHHGLPFLIGPLLLSAFLLHSALLAVSQAAVTSAITPDGTMGTTVTQSGRDYAIKDGTIKGSNLFHSFGRFSVGTDDRATFTGPNGITNILSRVTGGEQSLIDGRLRSEIPGANLFLLNPSGVLFGPNASLDVSGSFHVSTADYLRFADGAQYFASLSQESVLTMAAPAAFGFLGPNPAPITIQGSSLKVAAGKTLSVVGGDITIVGGTLSAPSGRLQLASVASPGEVVFSPLELAQDLQMGSFARLGRIEISQNALLDVSEPEMSTVPAGGGTVLIRGGRLLVDNSSIFADTRNADGARIGIDLQVVEDVVLANRVDITAFTLGAGRAGDLRIQAGSVEASNGAFIFSGASETSTSTGRSGDIEVEVGRLTLTGGSQISGTTFGPGQGGTVRITADSVSISGVSLQARPDGTFLPSGIFAGSQPLEAGAEGGPAGNIELKVGRLTLTDGGEISATTFGPGRGGTVRVKADSVSISGVGPQPLENGLFPPSGIFSQSGSSGSGADLGPAGHIELTVGRLTLTGGAQIGSTTFGAGQGGTVTIRADSVSISGVSLQPDRTFFSSGIFSSTRGPGSGGNIEVAARHIQLSDGGTIAANSRGDGEAGTILIQAGETFRSQHGSVTTASTESGGGTIKLNAGSLVHLMNNSEISTSVRGGSGDAGNITLDSTFVILEGSQIIANAFGGSGGNIHIGAGAFLKDPASRVEASSALGLQGTVDIRAPVTVLSETFALLPQTFVSAAALLPARCAARLSGGNTSSLVLGGRSGLRLDPGGLLPSPLVFDERLVTEELRPHPSIARFALLAADDKVFPRILGTSRQGVPPAALNWGCSK